jgi:hypothetical protein
MIDSKDISIVFQGPIEWEAGGKDPRPLTKRSLENTRHMLPGAELILSTWAGQKIDTLGFDHVIFNQDPGMQGEWPGHTPSNVNRQIASTLAGIKHATRPFVLKIRTDLVLNGTNFISRFVEAPPIDDDSRRIFKRPIVTNNLSSRNTDAILQRLPGHPLPFHPSDHASFGLAEDMLTLWDIPYQSEEDAWFFLDRSHPNRYRLHELSRLAPEQHILTSAIEKHHPVGLSNYADMSATVLELSQYYMSTHFVTVPDRLFPIVFPKYHTPHHQSYEWMRISPDKLYYNKTEREIARRDFTWDKRLTYPFRRPKRFAKSIIRGLGIKIP